MIKLPNLFLLGPAKTATTSLAYWLGQNKNIFVSEPKETLYFEFEYDRGVNFYLHKYFRHQNGEQVVVDGRPMNLTVGYCAQRIFDTCPDAKFVIVLRHPLERAYSDWGNWARMRPGRAEPNFREAIENNLLNYNPDLFNLEGNYVPFCDSKGGHYKQTYIEASMYWHQISRYYPFFYDDRFLFLNFDEVIFDSQKVVDKICMFMGIDNATIIDPSETNMVYKTHKRPKLKKIKSLLTDCQNQALSYMFKKDAEMMLKHSPDLEFIKKWDL